MYGASFPSFDNTTGAGFFPPFLPDLLLVLLLPGDDIMTDFECIQTTIQQYWTVHIHEHRIDAFVRTRLSDRLNTIYNTTILDSAYSRPPNTHLRLRQPRNRGLSHMQES
jgi:hypothetical protein